MRITKLKLNLPTKKKLVTSLHSCRADGNSASVSEHKARK